MRIWNDPTAERYVDILQSLGQSLEAYLAHGFHGFGMSYQALGTKAGGFGFRDWKVLARDVVFILTSLLWIQEVLPGSTYLALPTPVSKLTISKASTLVFVFFGLRMGLVHHNLLTPKGLVSGNGFTLPKHLSPRRAQSI